MEDKPKREMTPEEMEQRKKEMDMFFEKEIPFLHRQTEYETLVTGIEELRARRVRAQIMIAQALAPEPKEQSEKIPTKTPE